MPKARKPLHKAESLDLSGVLFRAAEPGIIVVNARKTITAFNRAAARMTRLESRDLPGCSVDLLPASLASLIEETFAAGRPLADQLVVIPPGAEERNVARANTFLWQARPDGPFAVLMVLQDLTSARELETKIERLQKLATVGTLSAGVAHEIKNALVAIKSFADLLLERQPDSDDARLVRREVDRIDALVSQLLKFAGPARPAFGPVKVHESLQNALRLVQHQLKTRQIEAVTLLDAPSDRVNGDAKQLEQAFLNLLLNAVEAMSAGGQLVVRTEIVVATEHVSRFEPKKREQQIQVEIKDTGPGMVPEVLGRLFTPFMTTKPGGTGLGLAITRRIVREHYGTISAETDAGRGTNFRILLPLLRTSD